MLQLQKMLSGCKPYSLGVLFGKIEVNLMTASHRGSEIPVSFLWHKSCSTLGFSTLQRAKQMSAVEECMCDWSQWPCNPPNACDGIHSSQVSLLKSFREKPTNNIEICRKSPECLRRQSFPSKQQLQKDYFSTKEGAQSIRATHTWSKPLYFAIFHLDTLSSSTQLNDSKEKKKGREKGFPWL